MSSRRFFSVMNDHLPFFLIPMVWESVTGQPKELTYLNKRFLEIEAGTLKSAKEYRQRNHHCRAGSFVFGKLNSTFYLRGGIRPSA